MLNILLYSPALFNRSLQFFSTSDDIRILFILTPITVIITATLGFIAYSCSFPIGYILSSNQFFKIIVMGAFWAVEVFFTDATGKMQDNFVGVDFAAFFQIFQQVAQFTQRCPPAASAARHIQISDWFINRIVAEAPLSLTE